MKFPKCMLVTSLWLFSLNASAATVVMDGPDTVTDILGLDVNGTVYNVSFEYDSFADLNTGGNFPFIGDFAGAVAADTAMLAVLNSTSAFFAGPSASVKSNGYSLAYDTSVHHVLGPQVSTRISGYVPFYDEWQNVQNCCASAGQSADHYYAVFTVVPIPAAVWLFGSGLGLLVWIRRRHTA